MTENTSKREFPYKLQYYDEKQNEKIKEDFSGYLRGALTVQPMNYFYPALYSEYAQTVYNFELKDDDVFVASYPKSGTTWTQEMVWLINNDLNYEGAQQQLEFRFPFIEADFVIDSSLFVSNIEMSKRVTGPPPGRWERMKIALDLPSPRCLKTHMPFSLLPPDILEKCKVIFVARDPRDVVVSYFHHHRLLRSHGFTKDFPAFFEYFINEEVMWSPFWTHLEEAYTKRDHPNLLLITYENMKADLTSVIQKVAKFLGKSIKEEDMPKLLQHLHVSSMKVNPAVNGQADVECGLAVPTEEGFIRKGKSGGWRDYFDDDMTKRFNEWMKSKSKGMHVELGWKL